MIANVFGCALNGITIGVPYHSRDLGSVPLPVAAHRVGLLGSGPRNGRIALYHALEVVVGEREIIHVGYYTFTAISSMPSRYRSLMPNLTTLKPWSARNPVSRTRVKLWKCSISIQYGLMLAAVSWCHA